MFRSLLLIGLVGFSSSPADTVVQLTKDTCKKSFNKTLVLIEYKEYYRRHHNDEKKALFEKFIKHNIENMKNCKDKELFLELYELEKIQSK